MLFVLTWGLVFVLLALWSLTCWSLHAVTLWAIKSASGVTGGAAVVADSSLMPSSLQAWMPTEFVDVMQSLLTALWSLLQPLLMAVPALGELITVLAWVVWGAGVLVLVALAIAAKIVITFLTGQRMDKNSAQS